MQKKTSNIIKVVIVAAVALVAGGLVLFSYRSPRPPAQGGDSMHGGTSAQSGTSQSGLDSLVGKPAPEFSLKDRNGTVYSPESLKGKNVVLFFNEGIMCYPACWNQMVALATDNRLQTADTVAYSIVTDSPDQWQQAITKMPALGKATILFDTDKSVSKGFGMLNVSSSMHYGAYPGHSFVVVDKEGIVRFVFDDPNMGINNDKVVESLKTLN